MLQSLVAAAAVLATAAFAQTTTDCNPLNTTCTPDTALGISNYTWTVAGDNTDVDWNVWNNTGGIEPTFDDNSAKFTVSKSGNAPGMKSIFYYFFGTVTVIMKASPGTGIISAITSLSDDLDEIDWEFKGGNDSYAFTNFYGKYQQGMEGKGTDVALKFDPRADYHNYTTYWTNSTLQWWVDGAMVRELKSTDPDTQGGTHFPQTPMQLHIGSWAAGDAAQPKGVQEWAGGATDYSKGPFDMHVAMVYVSDASTGSKYTYSDKSGSAPSIKIDGGNSTVADYLKNKGAGSIKDSVSNHFNSLSSGAKIGIAVAAICVAAVAALVFIVCCIKQRRAGRKEAAIADAEFQKQEADVMAYRHGQNRGPAQMPGFSYADFRSKR